MTQVGHLVMIAYGIRIFPLTKNLKQGIPDVTQPWYADDDGSLGEFTRLETYFDLLTRQIPVQGSGVSANQNRSQVL